MLIVIRMGFESQFIGWIQTLFRERVKSARIGKWTLNSESASKIMPACGI